MKYFIGVDVGTGSVRAALVNPDGKIVSSVSQEIKIWNPCPSFYQQSSKDIWMAVMKTVKDVCKDGGVLAEDVVGLGFDATCSLVVQGFNHEPISICPTGNGDCDIIMWMDHRASAEADFINSTKHPVLKYTGGVISLEMEPPKLLWLKKNLKETCWDKAGHFLDLCDFLTWRTTGSLTRSLCSVVSKWTYTSEGGFSKDFYDKIGLGDLCNGDTWEKIGNEIKAQGSSSGNGLTAEAASELGLKPGTPVGVGMIDAHAGSIGCLGCVPKDHSVKAPSLTGRMALISGTSTCHMAVSQDPIFVPGVWGPFWSSVFPGMWTAEGGQSAAGKLIDHIIETHPAYKEALQTKGKSEHISDYLYKVLTEEAKSQGLTSVAQLTHNFHMWPDYHGNRSPLADHTLTGMISGLTLRSDVVGMATAYLATVQALSYGTRHILSELLRCGHQTTMLYICGGLRKNKLYVSTHADVTGLPVIVPDEEESVLLGSAILGATAAGFYPSIQACMEKMCGQGEVTLPELETASYHEKKYKVFLKMYEHQRLYQSIMDEA